MDSTGVFEILGCGSMTIRNDGDPYGSAPVTRPTVTTMELSGPPWEDSFGDYEPLLVLT